LTATWSARSPAGTCRPISQPGGCGWCGQRLLFVTRALAPGWLPSWAASPGCLTGLSGRCGRTTGRCRSSLPSTAPRWPGAAGHQPAARGDAAVLLFRWAVRQPPDDGRILGTGNAGRRTRAARRARRGDIARACPAGINPYQRVELTAEPVVSFPQFEHADLHAVFKDPGADLRAFLNHPANNDVGRLRFPGLALPAGRHDEQPPRTHVVHLAMRMTRGRRLARQWDSKTSDAETAIAPHRVPASPVTAGTYQPVRARWRPRLRRPNRRADRRISLVKRCLTQATVGDWRTAAPGAHRLWTALSGSCPALSAAALAGGWLRSSR